MHLKDWGTTWADDRRVEWCVWEPRYTKTGWASPGYRGTGKNACQTLDGNVATSWCWISGLQNYEMIIHGFNSPCESTCAHCLKLLPRWYFAISVQEMNTISSWPFTWLPSKMKNLRQASNLQNVKTNKRWLDCFDKLPWLFKKKAEQNKMVLTCDIECSSEKYVNLIQDNQQRIYLFK